MERRRKTLRRVLEVQEDTLIDDCCCSPGSLAALTVLTFVIFSVLVMVIILTFSDDPGEVSSTDDLAGAGHRKLFGQHGISQKNMPDMFQMNAWGAGGQGMTIDGSKLGLEHQEEYRLGYARFSMNKYLSDRVSVRRSLPDVRPADCDRNITTSLQASVVVVSYNQPWTLLLRTVYSIVDRSGNELKEVILVDDGSTVEWLQYPILERYLSVLTKVRILRLPHTIGLAKARMLGFSSMSGDVVVFLHPHCECTAGWLTPLLAKIQADNRTIAVPVVDLIDPDTLQYVTEPMALTKVGSFTWDLRVTKKPFKDVPKSHLANITCPVVADEIFAVHKSTFLELGGYDEMLVAPDISHIELSFRAWMCGSHIDIVLCSHLGYLRPKPRTLTNEKKSEDTQLSSDKMYVMTKWMSKFQEFVLEKLPILPVLRSVKVAPDSCEKFDWYLNNLEPSMLMKGTIVKRGKLTHVALNETVLMVAVKDEDVVLHDWYINPTTVWYLLSSGQLRTSDGICLVGIREVTSSPVPDIGYASRPSPSSLLAAVTIGTGVSTQVNRKLLSYFKDLQFGVTMETSEDSDNVPNVSQHPSQFEKDYLEDIYQEKLDLIRVLHPSTTTSQISSSQLNLTKLPAITARPDHRHKSHRTKHVAKVKLSPCDSQLEKWSRWNFTKAGTLRHRLLNLCLSLHKGSLYFLRLVKCNETDFRQVWQFMWLNLTV